MTGNRRNIEGAEVRVQVKLFNRLAQITGLGSRAFPLTMPAGSRIDDVVRSLAIPPEDVFLVLVNGRDITPSLYQDARLDYYLQDGDVVALSGPVPYSWGYGAPVI